jgi:Cu/Ag efflux pump CusA
VFGDDLAILRRLGERVRDTVSRVPGGVDLSLEQQMDVRVIRFMPNRPAVASYRLHPGDVGEAIETSFAGASVGRIFDGATAFDLVVKLDPSNVADFASVSDLPIDTPTAGQVPIRLLAEVRREEGPNMVLRENVQRRIVVSCNVSGRDLGSVIRDIQSSIAQFAPMTAGYRVEYGGQFESQQSATRRLGVLFVGVVAGLFMLLVLALGQTRDAVIVMVNLPLSLIGGVAGVYLAGGVLSIASMIGFITLFGIATRNGIMLVSHIQHLMREEGVTEFKRAVERGALERLVPILMTAMAAGLAEHGRRSDPLSSLRTPPVRGHLGGRVTRWGDSAGWPLRAVIRLGENHAIRRSAPAGDVEHDAVPAHVVLNADVEVIPEAIEDSAGPLGGQVVQCADAHAAVR